MKTSRGKNHVLDCQCGFCRQDPEAQRRAGRLGGYATLGQKLSDKARANISAGQMGHPVTAETRAKISASHMGFKASPATRAKMAEAAARRHAAGVYFRGPTKLELALRGLLTSAGFNFQEQVRFGRYVVDAWVPSRRLVFEADGSFWYHHQDKEREARRDAYLMDRDAVAVVHLTEEDLIGIDKEES